MSDTDCRLNPEADWATIRQLRADLATAETGLKDAQWRLGELRIQLATVTAEWKTERAARDGISSELRAERAQHAETRKALEETEARWQNAWATVDDTRAALARSEARVQELELRWTGEVANHNCTVADAQAAIGKLEFALTNCREAHGLTIQRCTKAEARVKAATELLRNSTELDADTLARRALKELTP